MKLWIKFLIGALIGIVCAFILPLGNAGVERVIKFIAEIAVRFGRYMTAPVIFFTAITAFNKLRETRFLMKTSLWTFGIIGVSSLLLTATGLLSALLVKLPRIPITIENSSEEISLNAALLFRSLLPYSAFESLNDGVFLLAAFLFAALIGAASASDAVLFRPVTRLANALSKLMYSIGILFTEALALGMTAVSAYWAVSYRKIITGSVYVPLFIMLLVDFIIIAGIVYPMIVRYFCNDPHPYRILYASVASVITAFFSGDSNLAFLVNIRHCKESLGVRRRINGVANPLFTVFARGGAALVTATGFIAIWRSYSPLNIPPANIIWILAVSFGISLLLGGFASGGAFVSITVLCVLYGRGFENGFLLLKPAAPILCSFAAAYDAVTAIFGSYIIAVKTKLIEHHGIKNFI
ncbi:MAG: cation:dicarboxylate symporter family transporter [Treponema sp.]